MIMATDLQKHQILRHPKTRLLPELSLCRVHDMSGSALFHYRITILFALAHAVALILKMIRGMTKIA